MQALRSITKPKSSAALLLAFLGACGGSDDPQPTAVPFQTLQLQTLPSFPAGTYDIRTQAEWNAAWTSAPQTFQGDPTPSAPKPLPAVDFQSYSVVGVSLGEGIRCYVPQIVDVSSRPGELIVKYRSNAPSGPTSLACLRNWPLATFATVPRFQGAVSFIRVEN